MAWELGGIERPWVEVFLSLRISVCKGDGQKPKRATQNSRADGGLKPGQGPSLWLLVPVLACSTSRLLHLLFPLKEMPPSQETQETRVQSLDWEDPLNRKWQPTPVFLPGKFHGQRSLVGYRPWSHKEPDMAEGAHSEYDCPSTLSTQRVPAYLSGRMFSLLG